MRAEKRLRSGRCLLRWDDELRTFQFGRLDAGANPFIEVLLHHFEARIDDAAQFASSRRMSLLRARSGVGLDIALGGQPFEESLVARSSLFEFPGEARLRTCSAEDLIVLKSFAARAKDWLLFCFP